MFKKLKDKIEEVKQAPLLGLSPVPSPLKQESNSASPVTTSGHKVILPRTIGRKKENEAPLIDLTSSSEPTHSPLGSTINTSHVISNPSSSDTHVPILNLEASSPSSPSEIPLQKNIVFSPFSNVAPQEETSSRRSSMSSLTSESPLFPTLNLSTRHYNLISDLESEAEEAPTVNLDAYSKEDIYLNFRKIERRLTRYRTKYTELVAAYKDSEKEKDKIKSVLAQTQDKALRRIAELREQSQLDLKAKQHLEENFQMSLEEKDELIGVLNTKINLLIKESSSNSQSSSPTHSLEDAGIEPSALKEKIRRLEALLSKCKDTIKTNKERSAQLHNEKDQLNKELELKNKEIQELKNSPSSDVINLKQELESVKMQLKTLDQDGAMALAETKKEMHEELEQKERVVKELREMLAVLRKEKEQLDDNVNSLNVRLQQSEQHRTIAVEEMQLQLKKAEAVLEEEKCNLVQELSRGKAATISLLQQENEKRILELNQSHEEAIAKKDLELTEIIETIKKEHEIEMQNKEHDHEAILRSKELEISHRISEKEEQMKLAIEERELHKMATVTALDNKKDELQLTIDNLYSKQVEMEKTIESLKQANAAEIKEWTNQIEENSKRHKTALEELKVKHQDNIEEIKLQQHKELEDQILVIRQDFYIQLEDIQKAHLEEIAKIYAKQQKTLTHKIEHLKQQHEKRLDELNKKHQQNLLRANTDIDSAFKDQIELLQAEHHRVLQEKTDKNNELTSTVESLLLSTSCMESLKLDLDSMQKEKNNLIHNLEITQSEFNTIQMEMNELKYKYDILLQEKDNTDNVLLKKEEELKQSVLEFEIAMKNKDENHALELKKMMDNVESRGNEIHTDLSIKLSQANELISFHEQRIQDLQYRETELIELHEKTKVEKEHITAELNTTMESKLSKTALNIDHLHTELKNMTDKFELYKEEKELEMLNVAKEINSRVQEIDGMKEQLLNLQQICEDLRNEVHNKEEKVAELQKEKENWEQEMQKQQEFNRIHVIEMEKMQNELKILTLKDEELNKRLLQCQNELQTKEEQHSEVQEKLKKELENNEKLKHKFEDKRKKVNENIEKMKQNFQSKLTEKDEEFKNKLEEFSKQKNIGLVDITESLEKNKREQLANIEDNHQKEMSETNNTWQRKMESLQSDHESKIIEITLQFETKWKECIVHHQKELIAVKNVKQELDNRTKELEYLQSLVDEREGQIKKLQQELDLKLNEYLLLEQNLIGVRGLLEQIQNENHDRINKMFVMEENLFEKEKIISQLQIDLEAKQEEFISFKNQIDGLNQSKAEEWIAQIEKFTEMCQQLEQHAVTVEEKYEIEKNERQILEKENKCIHEELKCKKMEVINLNQNLESYESIQRERNEQQHIINKLENDIVDLKLEKEQLLNENKVTEEKLVTINNNREQIQAQLLENTSKYETLQYEKDCLETSLKQDIAVWEEKYDAAIKNYEEKVDRQKLSFEEQIVLLKQQIQDMKEQSRMTSQELENALQVQLQDSLLRLQQAIEYHRQELENVDLDWKQKMQEQKESFEKSEVEKANESEIKMSELEQKYQRECTLNKELSEKINESEARFQNYEQKFAERNIDVTQLEQALAESKLEIEQYIHVHNVEEERKKDIESMQQSSSSKDEEIANLKKQLVALDEDSRSAIQNMTSTYEKEIQDHQIQLQSNATQITELQNLLEQSQKEISQLSKHINTSDERQNVKLNELKKKAEMKLGQIKKQLHEEKDRTLSEYRETISKLQAQLVSPEASYNSQISELEQRVEDEKQTHQVELDMLERERDAEIEKLTREKLEENLKITDYEDSGTLNALKQQNLDLQKSYEDVKVQLVSLESDNYDLKSKLGAMSKINADSELTEQSVIVKKEYELIIGSMEKDHNSKIKQLVREFTNEMSQKEKEAQEAYQEMMEKNVHTEEQIAHEHRYELRELHKEIAEKNNRIEELLEKQDERFKEKEAESTAKLKDYENRLNILEMERNQVVGAHKKEISDLEHKLKTALRLKLRENESLHHKEVEELIHEWETERKHASQHTTLSPYSESQVLETENQLALSAVESSRESGELLRKQMMTYIKEIEGLKAKHRLEVAELKHHLERIHDGLPCPLLEENEETVHSKSYHNETSELKVEGFQNMVYKMGSDPWTAKSYAFNHPTGPLLTEPTEMEYLKNVLYEYMMGRETLTMAKVIAAVMKFPDDYTRRILEREEAKVAKWLPT